MSKVNTTKRTSGFTLIELLVVIAIIGILSSVVLASLNGARESSRDARRQTDLNQIQSALALYANENSGNYPTNSNISQLESQGYMSTIPSDPGNNNYQYCQGSSQTSFCIGATMEGGVPTSSDSACGGTSASDNIYTVGGASCSLSNI